MNETVTVAKTARFIKRIEWKSDARLYELSHPVKYFSLQSEGEQETSFVIVSAVNVPMCGCETYIFPADKDGNSINMIELAGSIRGILDHGMALINAGYAILPEDQP